MPCLPCTPPTDANAASLLIMMHLSRVHQIGGTVKARGSPLAIRSYHRWIPCGISSRAARRGRSGPVSADPQRVTLPAAVLRRVLAVLRARQSYGAYWIPSL
jgi:hypothetical protein